MAANGIFQFQQPALILNRSFAEEYLRFSADITNFIPFDNLVDIHAPEYLLLIHKTYPQWADFSIGLKQTDYIHRAYFLSHGNPPFLYIRIIAHLFDFVQKKNMVADTVLF